MSYGIQVDPDGKIRVNSSGAIILAEGSVNCCCETGDPIPCDDCETVPSTINVFAEWTCCDECIASTGGKYVKCNATDVTIACENNGPLFGLPCVYEGETEDEVLITYNDESCTSVMTGGTTPRTFCIITMTGNEVVSIDIAGVDRTNTAHRVFRQLLSTTIDECSFEGAVPGQDEESDCGTTAGGSSRVIGYGGTATLTV